MQPDSAPLVVGTDRGLYCPPGDFYIDPWQAVQSAVITHAHGDHLRHGSARYILARPGAAIARHRLGSGHTVTAVEYGAPVRLGKAQVSLHPAGHILGAAQVRIEHEGRVWVVSGDYKRQPDPTCAPFEQLECDVFISEATFALPVYRWSPTPQVVEEMCAAVRHRERGIASLLFCYASVRQRAGGAEGVQRAGLPHGAVDCSRNLYASGVEMVAIMLATTEKKTDYRGALIAPPSAAGTPWTRFASIPAGSAWLMRARRSALAWLRLRFVIPIMRTGWAARNPLATVRSAFCSRTAIRTRSPAISTSKG
jgi:putative mRNA 3-end processing factor